jgi:hypothetical protein
MGDGSDSGLEQLQETLAMMLANDGYSAVVRSWPEGGDGHAKVEIVAGPDACADCLVPKDVLAMVIADRLPTGVVVGEEDLIYP